MRELLLNCYSFRLTLYVLVKYHRGDANVVPVITDKRSRQSMQVATTSIETVLK